MNATTIWRCEARLYSASECAHCRAARWNSRVMQARARGLYETDTGRWVRAQWSEQQGQWTSTDGSVHTSERGSYVYSFARSLEGLAGICRTWASERAAILATTTDDRGVRCDGCMRAVRVQVTDGCQCEDCAIARERRAVQARMAREGELEARYEASRMAAAVHAAQEREAHDCAAQEARERAESERETARLVAARTPESDLVAAWVVARMTPMQRRDAARATRPGEWSSALEDMARRCGVEVTRDAGAGSLIAVVRGWSM